jgi:DNA-binding CsgD family transcriptional regulator
MSAVIWDALGAALAEMDSVRLQLNESRAQDRGSRVYKLLRYVRSGTEQVADVLELSGGWCLVHWPHDPASIALYRSILSLRMSLRTDNSVFILDLIETSARVEPGRTHGMRSQFELTADEKKVVMYVGQGLMNREIAMIMGLAESTVKNRLGVIFDRLDVRGRTQLALRARDLDLLVKTEPPRE